MATKLDYEQAIQLVTDDAAAALKVELTGGTGSPVTVTPGGALEVEVVGGTLVPGPYDYIALTYIVAGPGSGQVGTVTYKTGGSSGTTVATLTLGYDASNNLTSVTRT